MALDVASLFPQSTPMTGGMAGMFQGLQAGTAVNAAQQQMDQQAMQNQGLSIDLANKVADQPNVALNRQLTGLTTQGGIDNSPLDTAAKTSALKANIAKSSLSQTDDDLKEQFTRFSALDAADKYINNKDSDGKPTFDPGNMEHQREANKLLAAGHADHKFEMIGPQKQAEIAQAAPMARAASDALQNTLEQRQKLAQITQTTRGAVEVENIKSTTATGIANIEAQSRKDVAMFQVLAQQGATGVQMANTIMNLPEERQTAIFARYEKNKDGAISPETHTKLVSDVASKLISSKDPAFEIAQKAAGDRAKAWDAMDTEVARKAIVKEGLLTETEAAGFASKQALTTEATKRSLMAEIKPIAEKKVAEMGYGKVDPSVEPYDIPKFISQMGMGRTAERMATTSGTNPPTNTSQLPQGPTSQFTNKGKPPGPNLVPGPPTKDAQGVLRETWVPGKAATTPAAASPAAPASAPLADWGNYDKPQPQQPVGQYNPNTPAASVPAGFQR